MQRVRRVNMGYILDKVNEVTKEYVTFKDEPFVMSKDVSLMNLQGENWVGLNRDGSIDVANNTSSITVSKSSVCVKAEDLIVNSYGVFLMVDPNMIFMAGKHLRRDVVGGQKFYTKKALPQQVLTGVPLEGQKSVDISELMDQAQIFEDPSESILVAKLAKIVQELESLK